QSLDETYMKLVASRVHGVAATRLATEDKALLRLALSFYEQFAEVNRFDLSVRLEVTRAYRRASVIYQWLGQMAEEQSLALKALDISKQSLAEAPQDAELRQDLACCHGTLCLAYMEAGKYEDAEWHCDQVLRHQDAVDPKRLWRLAGQYNHVYAQAHAAK